MNFASADQEMKLRSTFDNIVERHKETLVGVLHNLLVGFNSTEFYNVWRKEFSDTRLYVDFYFRAMAE